MSCKRKPNGRFRAHLWEARQSWIGSADVINGREFFYIYRCRHCGDECMEVGTGGGFYEAVDPDYLRDRAIDP